MKRFFVLWFILAPFAGLAQELEAALKDIEKFQKPLNEEYSDPKESPLEPEELKKFTHHDFFPADLSWRVNATLVRTENAKVFKMKTTGARTPDYRQYGVLHFELQGRHFQLNVYQSLDLMKMEKYKDHLFLPFTDNTNDSLTYGAGRYIDLHIPLQGEKITIDFNQAYNPFCAYSHRYSCPVVPAENNLAIAVTAGVRMIAQD